MSSEDETDHADGGESSMCANFLAGVEEDVKSLLMGVTNAFDEYEELRFSHFVGVWREMKFIQIFRGRDSFREVYELTDGLFRIVKYELIAPGQSLGYRAAAIYALYSLYFKQPRHVRMNIRLSLSDLLTIKASLEDFREGNHWDILYCWSRLVLGGAFHFSAADRLFGIDAINNFYLKSEDNTSEDYLMTPSSSTFKKQGFQAQLNELADLQSRYVSMKKSLAGENDPALAFVNDGGFGDKVNEIISKAFKKPNESSSSSSIPQEIGERRKRLVDKYFGQTSESHKRKEFENFKNNDS